MKLSTFCLLLSGLVISTSALAQSAPNADTKTESIQTADTGWQVICRSLATDRQKLTCSLTHEVFSANDRSRLVALEISKSDKGRALLVSTPMGVNLTSGVEVSLDGASPLKGQFSSCQGNGCVSVIELSDANIASFKKSKISAVSFSDLRGAKIKIDVSLAGIVPAFAKMD